MLAVNDGIAAIKFYELVFGATVFGELHEWEGKIGHAELIIGDSKIMVADEFPEFNVTPERLGGTPVMIHLSVEDVDDVFGRGISFGGESLQEPKSESYGRVAKFKDPFGHIWFLWSG